MIDLDEQIDILNKMYPGIVYQVSLSEDIRRNLMRAITTEINRLEDAKLLTGVK